jgi:hypothetical protein
VHHHGNQAPPRSGILESVVLQLASSVEEKGKRGTDTPNHHLPYPGLDKLNQDSLPGHYQSSGPTEEYEDAEWKPEFYEEHRKGGD